MESACCVGGGSFGACDRKVRGFESRTVHQADVAQLVEAPPSEGGQCGFESLRRYQLDVVFNVQHAGFGRRWWRFESSRPDQCEMVELASHLALNQEFGVRTLVSQPIPMRLSAMSRGVGLLRRRGFLRSM